jgi:hypothetical protein
VRVPGAIKVTIRRLRKILGLAQPDSSSRTPLMVGESAWTDGRDQLTAGRGGSAMEQLLFSCCFLADEFRSQRLR